MAAPHPGESPVVGLKQSAQPFAADCLHTAISMILPPSGVEAPWMSTDRQPSTASYRLVSNSNDSRSRPGM